MRQRIFLLFKLFVATVAIFIAQKPLFMLFNSGAGSEVGVADYFDVMLHSLPLDLTTSGYVTALPFLVVLASWILALRGKKKFPLRQILIPYYVLISVVIALVFVADTVLYGFWGFKIDSTVFVYTDKPGDAVASVSILYLTVCVAAFVAVCCLNIWLYSKIIPKNPLSRPSSKWSPLVMIPLGGLLFLAIRGGVGEGTANVSNAYYSENQFLNHSAVNPVFNMLYSLTHQQNFAEEFRYFSDEKRKEIVRNIYRSENTDNEHLSDTLLTTQRPNILLIVWEGCGAKMVSSLGGYEGVTPCLDSIGSEGISFTQCYSNSFRTDRGLVSIMSGWLGMPSASLMKIPNKCNNLPGIARSLRNVGYTTDFWYGGDISFTNMGGFMLANGFQRTHSDSDFSSKDRSYSKWGVVDEILLDTLASEIIRRPVKADEPWFTSVLTLSSHEPWEVPYKKFDNEKQNAFAYTDSCIGKFVEKLKNSEQWKNLLVVIVPDHGVTAEDTDTRSSLGVIRIPLVFSGGALSRGGREINTIINQSDIAATLLSQLGVEHSSFAFSRDVLSSDYDYPTAIHTSPIDVTFIDSTGITTYDFNGDCVTFSSESSGDESRTEKAKAILQTLYDKTVEL